MLYRRIGKRCLDLLLILAGAVVALPILVVIAVAVRIGLGSPIFFRQMRAGRKGQPFVIWKFRTMTDARGADGQLLPDDQRLPWIGGIIRSTSMDELPQLWNVVRGEMSLVGPRPLPVEYVGLYSPEQARRLEAKPGMTGWTAVKGRSALEWTTKFELDVWYVDHLSLWLDLRILFLTVVKVLAREGVSYPGQVNSPPFQGAHPSGTR